MIDFYKEEGYRDARILADTLIRDDNNSNTVNLQFQTLKRVTNTILVRFNFIGNTIYSNAVLQQVLGLKKGDVYNGVLLKKRIADTSPNLMEMTSLTSIKITVISFPISMP